MAAENASLVATLCEQLDDARARVASLDAAVTRLSRANQSLTAALAERDEETRALRRALAARDDPRDVAPPSFVETFSWSDAVEREDALQRAADPPAPRENTRGADDRQGHPPGPTPPPRSLRPPPPSSPSPPPDRTFAAVVRPERDDLPVRRASREGFPSLSETPRAREGEEEEEEDEEERAKRAEAEEDRDEEERAKRAEAREDQDEYARATDSITSSDVHGDLDWPDIHAPRLPSKFVATFLWDLPRRSDATVRDADADAPADTNADAETARQKTRDVYRRAADALRAAFLAAGVCDASSCEVRRDRNVRRARLPLAGVGRADTDEPDDVFSRSLGPFYAVVRVRRWNDLELRDAVLASGRRAVPVPGFYEDQPLEIRVNVDRDRDRDRDGDRAAVARRLGRGFPGFDGIPFGAGGAWRRSRPFDSATLRSLQHSDAEDSVDAELPAEDSTETLRFGGGRERRRATLEGWRRTGRLQDTTVGRRPVHEGPCATCGAFADPNREPRV